MATGRHVIDQLTFSYSTRLQQMIDPVVEMAATAAMMSWFVGATMLPVALCENAQLIGWSVSLQCGGWATLFGILLLDWLIGASGGFTLDFRTGRIHDGDRTLPLESCQFSEAGWTLDKRLIKVNDEKTLQEGLEFLRRQQQHRGQTDDGKRQPEYVRIQQLVQRLLAAQPCVTHPHG